MRDRIADHNTRVLEKLRLQQEGVPAQRCSTLEALADPTCPVAMVFRLNDNDPDLPNSEKR